MKPEQKEIEEIKQLLITLKLINATQKLMNTQSKIKNLLNNNNNQ